jgi:hypothetical protein
MEGKHKTPLSILSWTFRLFGGDYHAGLFGGFYVFSAFNIINIEPIGFPLFFLLCFL